MPVPTQLDLVNLKVMRVTMMKMAMLEMAPQTKKMMLTICLPQKMTDLSLRTRKRRVCHECPLVYGAFNITG